MTKIIYIVFAMFLISCSKKGTLDDTYWGVKESGTYTIVSVQTKTYQGQALLSDETLTDLNTVYTLEPSDGYGFGYGMTINGTWKPVCLNVIFTDYAWVVENDNKRITLGYFDPNVGFMATGTLSVEKMGKKHQVWTYIQISPGGEDYINQIITVEKTN